MEYNLAGLPERQTDAQAREKGFPYSVQYSYNGLGQKTGESYPGALYTYAYDGAGSLLTAKLNGITTQTVSYDGLNQAVAVTDGRGNTTTRKWNLLGKLSEEALPGDDTIAAGKKIYQYDRNGSLVREKDSAGKVTATEYDTLGRAIRQTATGETGERITLTRSYDLNSNLLSETDGRGNTCTTEYDALNRITARTNEAGQRTTYTYDRNGNLRVETRSFHQI